MNKALGYYELLYIFMTRSIKEMREACQKPNLNIRSGDSDNETILITSIVFGLNIPIRFLIENGADVNLTDARGKTPLMWAAIHDNTDAMELLLCVRGIQKHAKDPDGWNALDFARYHNKQDAIEMLEEEGLVGRYGT